ncbi:dDENN domain-containing protein [Paracoccidioides lutzii Pb01]|uniref:DDENN domain-containing protein n=1 Tax=Paracoccidioides lutzii (strain ATCC MYA-826 / Pb01) TaxID=502779 RepID=C1H0R7_PARBA|nr:dDENN domain-containing protein [Paracoccidioides lutzii Pb01]EEH33311.1 dDENN domain-containing protein [Paracoccidioides lutzii Pb01]
MAPLPAAELHASPLADFFWIAGVDGAEIFDIFSKLGEEYHASHAQPLPVTDTIQEDADAEEESLPSGEFSQPTSKRNSCLWLPKPSDEARLSLRSVSSETPSNWSSMTIKGSQSPNGVSLLSDGDFDRALLKFAAERDSFLSDLSLSAGASVSNNRPKPRPKTQRIVAEEINTLKSGIGSVRRHMSFRDMNSMKRQPSIARQASIRTSRRLSNYNSVIPVPQPLDVSPNMHPLKRKFEPVLLDRYPPKGVPDDTKRRGSFPDYVPMFAFPNDINIVSSDQRPRSSWHGFAMTSGDGSKLYGVCVTIWIPLSHKAAEELEKRCEEWRRDNMTDEERELAASLGERLAMERARLSRLLAQLPSVPSGSASRDQLEDEISSVEEKIGLMADLLRPVRLGAATKIDGLTDGDTGFWIPRAYGILGKDGSMTSFWKEWLRAVVVPMTDGAIQRVPASSPRVGRWQPLERYIVNLCTEAFSPLSSKTQVELSVRELRLFARKEADNELPGSRNTDLYALFRCLSISNIIILFEYVLAESRIILLSSHAAMLHLASKALVDLLFPFQWTGVFIPILPARLIQVLEAPCPYIVGIERRYEKAELPSDDFVLVDLDQNEIESTARPTPLPRHHRRKLQSLLQLAAPLHHRYGIHPGPPCYAIETYPFDSFPGENQSIFSPRAMSTQLDKYVSLNSTAFGQDATVIPPPPNFNVFLNARNDVALSRGQGRSMTSSTSKVCTPPSPKNSGGSPTSTKFSPLPPTPVSRNDSGFALQSSLREKRSGHFDAVSRRSYSFGDRRPGLPRRPSAPFLGHTSNLSVSTLNTDTGTSVYAASIYAQSTLAASTIMPQSSQQALRNPVGSTLVEGHCLQLQPWDDKTSCSICDEKAEEGMYKCSACGTIVHTRCASQISLVCPVAFYPEQVRAAFVRCFASLLYTYKKFLQPASGDKKKAGLTYDFNMDAFLKSLPHEHAEYMTVLQQTQAFNEFISERERATPSSKDPRITLFDEIILSKRNRGRTSVFSGRMTTNFLSDTSDHLWWSASATAPPSSRHQPTYPSDWKNIVTRTPAKLDPNYMKEPRMIQGEPRINKTANNARRKPVATVPNA